jgi:hypothetical protein
MNKMKNKTTAILSATILLAFAFITYLLVTNDSSFTKWMSGSEYQKYFDQKYEEGFFPIVVEAKSSLSGSVLFRACYVPFPKYPEEAFWFYSNHGISTQDFENRNKKLKADNFSLAYHQAFEASDGGIRHQATWVKSRQ